jgi:hypothetical protein
VSGLYLTLLPPSSACVTAVTKDAFIFAIVLAWAACLRHMAASLLDDLRFGLAKMRQHLALGSQSATRLSERQTFLHRVRWFRDITLREGRSLSPLLE